MTLSELAASREAATVGTPEAHLTLFASATATTPQADISLTRFISQVHEGHWEGPVASVRGAAAREDREKLAWLKRRLPALTLSCTMDSRAKDAPSRARTHSGWLQCDFDAKDNPALIQSQARALLAADPHVGAVFVGPSGLGIKAALRIDPANHIPSVEAAATYFLEKYALSLDRQCRDLERLCFVSHDPQAWLRPDPATILPVPESTLPPREPAHGAVSPAPLAPDIDQWTMADVRELLGYLPQRPDYDTWLRIASGVFCVLPLEPAITVLNQWSPEEKPGEYQLKHRNRLDRVTIASVIAMAQKYGFDARAAARRKQWSGRVILSNWTTPPHPPSGVFDRTVIDYRPPLRLDVPNIWDFPASDQGRAQCYLAHFGKMLRYCPQLRRWRLWHGHRWHDDDTLRAHNYVHFLSQHEMDAFGDAREDFLAKHKAMKEAEQEKRLGKMLSAAVSLGNQRTIHSLIEAATMCTEVVTPLPQWDADPWLIGTKNGVFDLKVLEHRKGRPEDLVSKSLAAAYDPTATCPNWQRFIERILPGDLGTYIQQLAGYSLTGNTDDGAFYFCHGAGKNGKTILIETLASIFADYAALARVDMIEEVRNANPKNDLADLPGVRFLYSEETNDDAKFRVSLLKAIATGANLKGERKYCDGFEFKSATKLWIGGNHKPKMDGADYAAFRRMRLIPFNERITDTEEIPREALMTSLKAESSGILNWMIEGLRAWKIGFSNAPQAVQDACNEYRNTEDELADFLVCATQDAEPHWTGSTKKIVYDAFCKWSALEGVKDPMGPKKFTLRLKAKGWKMNPGNRFWIMKSIKDEADW